MSGSPPVVSPNSKVIKPPQTKTGFLLKQGRDGFIRIWNNRYFVLNNGTLSYFESSSAASSSNRGKGVMCLKGIDIICKEGKSVILLTSGGKGDRDLQLDIRSPSEKLAWINSLRLHIAYANSALVT